MMKKFFLAALLYFAANSALHAQAAKSAYVEIGGPGLASINFDTRFSNREDGLGGRIGVGGFGAENVGLLTVPVGLNYLIGKDNRNYFEVGAGFTYVHLSDNTFNEKETFDGSFGHLTFGYRLQPANGGFTFRAAVVPIFGQGGFVPYYGGISFGYKF